MITLTLLTLLLSFISYYVAFYAPEKQEKRLEDVYKLPQVEGQPSDEEGIQRLIEEMKALPCEEVWITAFDGTKLHGRYYHVRDDAPLQIQFHGYRGTAFRDFSGGNKLARRLGFNTLLIDQRAHGQSEGHTITFGVNESKDCLSWIDYAVRRFGEQTPIYLAGVSMGAATVITAAGESLPQSVKGVIADCPFSESSVVIKNFVKKMKLPPKLVYPFLVLGAKIYGRVNINGASPKKAMANVKIPVLILHGEADSLVPCEMSKELYSLNPQMVWLETFPNAEHGLSYVVDPARYERVVQEFVEECER